MTMLRMRSWITTRRAISRVIAVSPRVGYMPLLRPLYDKKYYDPEFGLIEEGRFLEVRADER